MRLPGTVAFAAVVALSLAPPAQAQRGLTTGFFDSVYAESDEVAASWLDRTASLGAGRVRQSVSWRDIAPPQRPAGFDAADPAASGYRWAALDLVVQRLDARGLDVLLSIDRAPDWAEGPRRRAGVPPGAWRPDPAALADFGTAIARRYSGSFGGLPRVRDFMLWNEPNLERYLAPQWTRRGHGFRAASPAHYRRMLGAFGPAIKAVHSDNRVIAGATSPYGDPEPGGARMPPARFVREWLCVNASGCRRQSFDVLSHHPYSVGHPRRRALNRDDVSIPDLGKLTRLLRAARRKGTITRTPRLWVTEVSYDSRPPDPRGVPAAKHARWVAETLYLSWKQGAGAVIWLLIRDAAPTPSYAASYQSGMFLRDGTPKRAARAFRFPFVVDGRRAWGKSPAAGRLVIERRSGRRWRTVRRLQVRKGAVFVRRVAKARGAAYRARVGSEISATWR